MKTCIQSAKHTIITTTLGKNNNKSSNIILPNKIFACKYCNKPYKYAPGVSRHMQKCIKKSSVLMQNNEPSDVNVDNIQVNALVMKCFEVMAEQTQTINNIIPYLGTNNTINNKFNLNVYLNETCKNAVNFPEFVNNISLQLSDLLCARKEGLLTSTKSVLLQELQKTEPKDRPIQCTDTKRKTMYVKEDGSWSKDIGNEKIKEAFGNISHKHVKLVKHWEQANPAHMDNEQGQMELVKIIQTATKNINEDTRLMQSAVKEIGETVHISHRITG